MFVRKVTRNIFMCMFPKYREVLQKHPKLPIRCAVKAEKCFQNMEDILELYHSRVLSKEEIASRREKVAEFLGSNTNLDEVELDYVPSHSALLNMPVEQMLASCGDDPSKIAKLMGLYGLAMYSAQSVRKILPEANKHIKETGYLSETVDSSFRNYLSLNKRGYVSDLKERYGKCGEMLFEDLCGLGAIHRGADADFKATYSITPHFLKVYANI